MNEIIKFPDAGKWSYKGRNGFGICTGVRLSTSVAVEDGSQCLTLEPMTSKEVVSGSCRIELPADTATRQALAAAIVGASVQEGLYQMTLPFIRNEGRGISTLAILQFKSPQRLLVGDVLKRLRKAITAWCTGTDEGREVYDFAAGDLNIGDIELHGGFSDEALIAQLAAQGILEACIVELVDGDGVANYDSVLVDEIGDVDDEEGEEDEEEGEVRFLNHYTCPRCSHSWKDVWSAQCDDDCPKCGERHISPHTSEDA